MNINEWIELKLKSLRMFFVILSAKKRILKNEYFDKLKKIVRYFMTLQKSSEMNIEKFRKWKTDVFKFKIQNRHFFRRNSKNIFMRRVINNFEKKNIKKFTWRNRTSWKKKNVSSNCWLILMKSFVWKSSQLREKLRLLLISWFYSWKENVAFDLNFVFVKKNCNWRDAYVYESRKIFFDCCAKWFVWINWNSVFFCSKCW